MLKRRVCSIIIIVPYEVYIKLLNKAGSVWLYSFPVGIRHWCHVYRPTGAEKPWFISNSYAWSVPLILMIWTYKPSNKTHSCRRLVGTVFNRIDGCNLELQDLLLKVEAPFLKITNCLRKANLIPGSCCRYKVAYLYCWTLPPPPPPCPLMQQAVVTWK